MEILGEKTKLRPLEEQDLRQRAEWIADPEIAELMGAAANADGPYTSDEWYKEVKAWFDSRSRGSGFHLFAIEDLSGRLIGDIDLQIVGKSEGMGWMTIEIGDKDYWGKGYGTDAVSSLLRHAFRRLGLRQIRLNVRKFNTRAIRCYEKCGFIKESEEDDDYLMVAVAETCDL